MSWQEFKSGELEQIFNPRAALGPKTKNILADWKKRSVLARSALDIVRDISYGDHVLQTFDYCQSSKEKPAIILLHGGYWRSLDKSVMDCHVQKLFENGFTVFNVNYPLCPEVSLTQLVEAVHASLEKIIQVNSTEKNYPKFILMGHSAGAHLAFHLAMNPLLKNNLSGIIALSGIFECQVVRAISVNKDVCLSQKEADELSNLKNLPLGELQYYVAVGAEEPSGWIDQSVELYGALSRCNGDVKLRVVSKANHFNVVDKILDANTDHGQQLYDWVNNLSDDRMRETCET